MSSNASMRNLSIGEGEQNEKNVPKGPPTHFKLCKFIRETCLKAEFEKTYVFQCYFLGNVFRIFLGKVSGMF